MNVFAAIVRLLGAHAAVTVITVIGARGSVPREAGARMVVAPGGGFHGTVGGGNLEWQALALAQSLLGPARDRFETRRFALGPELGQCCGGAVTLGFEVFTRARLPEVMRLAACEAAGAFETIADMAHAANGLQREVIAGAQPCRPSAACENNLLFEGFGRFRRPLYLYGAGHVGRAVMLAMVPLDFAIHWIDERPEIFPDAIPSAVQVIVSRNPAAVAAAARQGAFALIMTHNHAQDLEILHAALQAGQHAHIGVIGSATKRARFEKRLQALGIAAAAAVSFQCPVGLPELKSREPAVIAAGVACDLLLKEQALASLSRASASVPAAISKGVAQ